MEPILGNALLDQRLFEFHIQVWISIAKKKTKKLRNFYMQILSESEKAQIVADENVAAYLTKEHIFDVLSNLGTC